jgi:hypothetical protein
LIGPRHFSRTGADQLKFQLAGGRKFVIDPSFSDIRIFEHRFELERVLLFGSLLTTSSPIWNLERATRAGAVRTAALKELATIWEK